jgi:hypothetical protein
MEYCELTLIEALKDTCMVRRNATSILLAISQVRLSRQYRILA